MGGRVLSLLVTLSRYLQADQSYDQTPVQLLTDEGIIYQEWTTYRRSPTSRNTEPLQNLVPVQQVVQQRFLHNSTEPLSQCALCEGLLQSQ